MTEDEAIDICVRGLKSAMKRDAGSGEGIQIVVIKKDYHVLGRRGVKKVSRPHTRMIFF